jgi:stage V sporulation protein R
MEECKERARSAGLNFRPETLEYIVTNRDMINLSPKAMIPTLYDYWVNDVEVLRESGKYKLYPHNPYETVINSRPAISFYNDNNPDWMNVMIFYHVLAHIDFFQNNILFENTWNDDFVGQALADKRLIEALRSKHGRWVDYIIEFSRGIDNITAWYRQLPRNYPDTDREPGTMLSCYLNNFLQDHLNVPATQVYKEIERYNYLNSQSRELAESMFFSEVKVKYPEFQTFFESRKKPVNPKVDVLEFLKTNSPYLKKDSNNWMKQILSIVGNTANYFAPQIRSKIINEGWASYWHDELFRSDPRICGHETDYARLNAGVTSISRIGLNPYAIGLRLIQYVEELANKGRMHRDFLALENRDQREAYDLKTGKGKESIFDLRAHFSDYMLIKTFADQDFVDQHNLFVVGKQLNEERGQWEYYIKSRKAEDYKQMLLDSLYHPPMIDVDESRTNEDNLYLVHHYEGKQLYQSYVPETLMGIEFLWGAQVQLETTERIREKQGDGDKQDRIIERRVLFTIKDRRLTKSIL